MLHLPPKELVNQLVERQSDKAGNSTSTTVGNINIDKTKPSITINSPRPKEHLTSEILTLDFSANDSLSSIASIVAKLDGSLVTSSQVLNLADMAGSHTLEIAASDKAGEFGFACGMNMVHGTLIVEEIKVL